jgi:uncharacterized protein (UPF0335 family)
MSSRVKTRTPFLNKAILLQALDAIGCKYTEQGGEILTQRTDWFGNQRFIFQNGRYFFQHDEGQHGLRNIESAGHKSVHSFLGAVEQEYKQVIANMEAAERERIEQERRAYVAKQKEAIIAKAHAQGYDVREETVQETVKLVLVRNTY